MSMNVQNTIYVVLFSFPDFFLDFFLYLFYIVLYYFYYTI